MNSDWPNTWNAGAEDTPRQPLNSNVEQMNESSLLETILRLALHSDIPINNGHMGEDQPHVAQPQQHPPRQSSNIDFLAEYSTVMRAYNANIQGYISSMNAYNDNMRQLMNDMRVWRRSEYTTDPIYDFTYVFQPNLRQTHNVDRTPHVDRVNNRAPILSQDQITMATRLVQYSPDINESRCPISLDNFVDGEEITQIIHCGHVFRTNNLMNWFRRSSRCPVCRHNIMTYTPPNSTSGDAGYT